MTDDTEHKRDTATSFDEAAEAYLNSETHREGADLDRLVEWCADATRALDVATGGGHTAGALSKAGVTDVHATDAAPRMIATAYGEYPGVRGIVADAERLPFAADSFDVVTCRIAAHHFPDPRAFVDEVGRVLESDGTFALEDIVPPEKDDAAEYVNALDALRDPTHVEAYPVSRWRDWLTDAGLAIETVDFHKTEIGFDYWVESQSLSQEKRERVERKLLDAPPAAAEYLDVSVEDGSVSSFTNLKGLFRARRD